MDISIRKMAMGDIPEVLEIDKLSFPNPWPENSYRYEILENKNSVCWVAEVDSINTKKIMAMAVVWVILDEIHIGTIAIHPDFRNQGIGTIFLSKIFAEAVKDKMMRAFLEVRQSNQAAINLYKKFGFGVDGIRKKYYRDNQEDAILMSASLGKQFETGDVSFTINNLQDGDADNDRG